MAAGDRTASLDEQLTPAAVDTDPPPAPPAGTEPPLPAGGMLGRYHLIEVLGAGGMGVVYLARDPMLDRAVALKVVHADRASAGGQAQLVREAQAMARLQHPNVVTVHDVGVVDGRVFVSMERIEGETLRAWLKRPRPWREVVSVFIAAGRGLGAAHAAGIVHRDFKPENVLVAASGRVCVADFGLAHPAGGDAVSAVGTPLYMAPEQHDGGPITAAADQYAFCVALWEGVHGVAPFEAKTVPELAAAKRRAQLAEPGSLRPPGWLVALLRRGLVTAPEARHPSIDVLVAALERGLRRRRSALLTGAAVALLGTGSVVTLPVASSSVDSERSACSGAAAALAQAWPPEVRTSALARVASLGAYGASVAPTLSTAVDDFASRWAAGHRDACVAHRHGAQSDDLLDRRMACLERGRAALAAVADVVTAADQGTLPGAVLAVRALPDPAACADLPALLAAAPRPPPALAGRVAGVDAAIERGLVDLVAGRHAEAEAAVTRGLSDARALGYRPLLARALLANGRVAMSGRPRSRAVAPLAEATALAVELGDDALAVEAWARRAWASGTADGADAANALDGVELVEAHATRLPMPSFARALLDNNVGAVALARSDRDGARVRFDRALAEARGIGGADGLELVVVRRNLALVTDDPAARDGLLADAEADLTRWVGPGHPQTLRVHLTRAMWQPDPDRVIELLEACPAFEVFPAILGSEAVECWLEDAFLAEERGDRPRAIAALERAVAVPGQSDAKAKEAAGYHALWTGGTADSATRFAAALAELGQESSEPRWRTFDRGRLELGLGRARRAVGDLRGARDAVRSAVAHLDAVTRAQPAAYYRRRLERAQRELAELTASGSR